MKLKLLFISQQLPYPLNDGGNIRTYNILKALSAKYDITLIASIPSALDHGSFAEEAKCALSSICSGLVLVEDVKSKRAKFAFSSIIRAVLNNLPFSISYNFNFHIMESIESVMKNNKFDFLHLNHLDSWQYFSHIDHDMFVTIDTHNLMYELYSKYSNNERNIFSKIAKKYESWLLLKYEKFAFKKADSILLCSCREKKLIKNWDGIKKVTVVPNGVDINYFDSNSHDYSQNPPVLVFTGAMNYKPNNDAALFFIKEIMPLLRCRFQDVKFLVVGKNPSTELLGFSKKYKDVQVTGRVNDVREYIKSSKIYVVPIRSGAGTRLKVLEAFSMGIPTVSSTIGAEGIDYDDGSNILIADSPIDFCDKIELLLSNEALFHQFSVYGRKVVEAKYSWDVISEKLIHSYVG